MSRIAPISPSYSLQMTRSSHTHKEVRDAYKAVITSTLADIFALHPEEVLWTDYSLDKAFDIAQDCTITDLPVAVEDELDTGKYSAGLFSEDRSLKPITATIKYPHATLDDWSSVFTEMIEEGFALSAIAQAGIFAIVKTLLSEIGVGHEENPRGAYYLPNTIRWRLTHN